MRETDEIEEREELNIVQYIPSLWMSVQISRTCILHSHLSYPASTTVEICNINYFNTSLHSTSIVATPFKNTLTLNIHAV